MPDSRDMLRHLPSVNDLADRAVGDPVFAIHPRGLVVGAIRDVVDQIREEILLGDGKSEIDSGMILNRVRDHLTQSTKPPLGPVINATGIILHTGLGRAPLAQAAVAALTEVAANYAPVELDMKTGERGSRSDIVRKLLQELTGAESATVVNNNAAALILVLATVARDRSVIVSRGELIEIGGSFRLPEVMRAGGAILREVGTTNRTSIADYENAIGPSTAALLRVHTSNFRVEGFTQSVRLPELVTLGRNRDVVVIDDIGSGLLSPSSLAALKEEPDARSSIQAGADLVLFSGDKLLGGPQAGIIVGKRALINEIERNPLMRALRVDKITLAGLGATLQLHRDPELLSSHVPVHVMMSASLDDLRDRARKFVEAIRNDPSIESITIVESDAFAGGGSVPTRAIPSIAVRMTFKDRSPDEFAAALRPQEPGILARRHDGAVWFDLRTVLAEQDELLVRAVREAIAGA